MQEFPTDIKQRRPQIQIFIIYFPLLAHTYTVCFLLNLLRSPLVRLLFSPDSLATIALEWLGRALSLLVPGLSYIRVVPPQPVEWGMSDEAAVKVCAG